MRQAQETCDSEPRTIKELMLKHLVTNGLSTAQAEEVLARFAGSDAGEPMLARWGTAHAGYPATMMAILRMGVNQEAVKFIDETIPQHWARPMFAGREKVAQ